MKMNSLKTFAAAALAVLAFGCAKENVADEGEKSQVTFTVDVPEATVTTRGLSDAATTNELICQVFLNDSIYTPVTELNQTVEVKDRKATVNFTLVKGNKYAFIFWAQAKGTDYYETTDLRSVKMNVAKVKANEPKMDAFWATETLTATANPSTKSKTLYRALAQVNFGSKMPDRSDALAVTESSIKMTGVADTFHPFYGNNSKACEGSVDITFANNATITDEKLKVSEEEYDYLATAYVFAAKTDKSITDVEATITLKRKDKSTTTTTVKAPNAPIQGNYRTNILGDLLTVGSTWTITIDSEFKGGDLNYDAVSANLEKGGNVTLSENYSVASKSAGVTIPLGVTSTLNLNGKKFSNVNGKTGNKAALQVHGNLTINGDGEVYCEGGATNNAIIVEQGGNLTINGGTYNVGKDANGTSNTTIYVAGPDQYGRNGSVKIYGGTFKAEEGSDGTPFVLNQSDDITTSCFTVYGGTFIGFNPASVNEAHGEITSFVAEGYKSVKVSDSPETWEVLQAVTVTPETQDDFNAAIVASAGQPTNIALASNATVTLDNGVANEKGDIDITVIGDGSQTFDVITKSVYGEGGQLNYQRGSSFTLKNLKIKAGEGNFDGVVCDELTFENCTITGKLTLYSKATFINCTFDNTMADQYSIWTWGGTDLKFEGCTFNTNGKAILLYGQATAAKPTKLTIVKCKFNDSNNGAAGKAAIEIGNDYNATYVLNMSECTVNGFADGKNTGSKVWANKNSMDAEHLSVTIDGVKVF